MPSCATHMPRPVSRRSKYGPSRPRSGSNPGEGSDKALWLAASNPNDFIESLGKRVAKSTQSAYDCHHFQLDSQEEA